MFYQDFINWWKSFQQQNPTFWTFQTPPGWSLRWSKGWPGWWSPRWWLGRWPRWQSRWWRPLSVHRVRLSPQSNSAKGRSQYLSFLCLSCGTFELRMIICWIFENNLFNIWELFVEYLVIIISWKAIKYHLCLPNMQIWAVTPGLVLNCVSRRLQI